jgi:hypothetical protein
MPEGVFGHTGDLLMAEGGCLRSPGNYSLGTSARRLRAAELVRARMRRGTVERFVISYRGAPALMTKSLREYDGCTAWNFANTTLSGCC